MNSDNTRVRVPLVKLHDTLLRLSFKNDAILEALSEKDKQEYLIKHFTDNEYYIDNWYDGIILVSSLVIANDEFRSEIELNKENLYIDEWSNIKPHFTEKWLIPENEYKSKKLLPIILREDSRKGLYRVWDGQKRVLNALNYNLETIHSYFYTD